MIDIQKNLQENFKSRNIEVEFFIKLEAVKDRIIELIPQSSTVGIGNSQTLKVMKISQELKARLIICKKTLLAGILTAKMGGSQIFMHYR